MIISKRTEPRFRLRRKWILFALVLAVFCIVLFLASETSGPSGRAVEWLSAPPESRKARLEFLGRWSSPVRVQLLRARQWFTGPLSTVTIRSEVLEFQPAIVSAHLPMTIWACTNAAGVRAYLLPDDASVSEGMVSWGGAKRLSRPQIVLGDGLQGQVSASQSLPVGSSTNSVSVGWSLDVQPRVSARAVDLACFFTSTGTNAIPPFVRTNTAFGVRAKIPENMALFIVSGATNENGKVIGLMVSPKVWRPRK